MFLLRRKEDGKFYTNKGYHGNNAWVDSPSECKPFATEGGVRHSRAVHSLHPDFDRPPYDSRDREAWGAYHKKVIAWFARSNTPARKAYFDLHYEIVPVTIVKISKGGQ